MTNYRVPSSHRALAFLLSVALTLLLFGAGASAATETTTFNMVTGGTITRSIQNRYNENAATVLSSSTADNSIATVSNTSSNFTINAVAAGQTTVTVNVLDTSNSANDTWIITVVVTGNSSSTTKNVTIARGNSVTLDNFSSVTSHTSSSSSIASTAQSGTAIIATGNAVGSCTITVVGVLSGNSTSQTYLYNITVTDSSSTSTGTSSSSVTLRAGQNALIGQGGTYSSVTSYSSTNNSVASVSLSGAVVTISGLTAGSATITYIATIAATGQVVTYTIYVTVSGSVTNTDYIETVSTSSSGSGLSIGVTERLVAEGKSYRLKGITMNGSSVAANELLWLSSDDTVVTVNKSTGVFKAQKVGTARLIAVDPLGRYHLTVAITVQ